MTDADGWIRICDAIAVVDTGAGVRFPVAVGGRADVGFVVRFAGAVHGYLNRCAHAGVPLDWQPGEFFERSGLYLMCSVHGAVYTPSDGKCAGGPCRGGGLRKIRVVERDAAVFWKPDGFIAAPAG